MIVLAVESQTLSRILVLAHLQNLEHSIPRMGLVV